MKKRKVAAMILACSMLLGQTVWAQDMGVTAKVAEDSQETQGITDFLESQDQQELQSGQLKDAYPPDSAETELEEEKDGESQTQPDENQNQQNEENCNVDTQEEKQKGTEETEDADGGEQTEEELLAAQADEVEKKSICVNYPIVIDLRWGTATVDDIDFSVESENEEICQVTKGILEGNSGHNWLYFTIDGKKKGTTTVNASFSGTTRKYEITVNELPQDAVMFKDIGLRSRLVDGIIDTNEDGCINKDELNRATHMYLAFGEFSAIPIIKDLSGLENAVNLTYIDLSGNAELSDISALFGLEKLQSVHLAGTNVSDADRWKLADFKDCTMSKGDRITLPSLGALFEEGLTVEAVDSKDCVEIESSGNAAEILAKEAGETRLHISYHDLSKDITVTVQGIQADQEVGEDYPVEIRPRPSISANAFYSDEGLILDSNHQLWQLYPEPAKKKDNVKDYVANWVYYGADRKNAEIRTYLLDNDNNLWKDTEKLSESVEKFDGRYALDSQGTLHNVYNSGNERIENVTDWISPSYGSQGVAYLLKKDRTLWTRQESAADQKMEEWRQIESNVKQLYEDGYLKTDGTVVSFDGTKTTNVKADRMCEDGNFYDKDGNYYFCITKWNGSTHEYEKEYINMGKIEVKQAESYGGEDGGVFLLNQEKQVYKYDLSEKKMNLLMTDVLRINEGLPYYWSDSTSWAFQLSDGKYYDLEGKAMAEARIGYSGYEDDLIWHEDGSQAVVRNGVTILTSVTTVWRDRIEGAWRTYACRTDGTIWDITGVPEQILDLKSASYLKGDVDEDGTVDIKDLRLILRHVCEKIKLTDRQIMIADVVNDGTVNIHDLRKELRYVCGKLESLD